VTGKHFFKIRTKRKRIVCISSGMNYSAVTAYSNWS